MSKVWSHEHEGGRKYFIWLINKKVVVAISRFTTSEVVMAKNYERVDFTYLLDELQGNTVLAPVDEEPIKHMEIKKIKVQEAKGDMAIYEDI